MASRARRAGRAVAKGAGGTVLGVGVGAIGYGIHGISGKITAPGGDMNKYPALGWIPGVAMAAAGHFMKQKSPKLATAGIALTGAAGFSLAEYATLAYTIKQNAKAQAASTGTQGLIADAGAVMSYNDVNDTGALLTGHEVESSGFADVDASVAQAMLA
jgi:hypothetical protein